MPAPPLFTPFAVRGTTLRNRLVLSPMCQYQAVDGLVQDWHLAHHARYALAGLGAAFVEATAVAREGRITHGCTGIWDDAHVPGLARLAGLHKAHGVVPGIQIGHAGRRASAQRPWEGAQPLAIASGSETPWQTVGASPVPEREGFPVPRELSNAGIEELIEAFAAAARRALAAGFEIVEVHGAHGYLIHSFLSPVTNRRADQWGGSREKRMRFPLTAARAVRKAWPADKPVFYRTSSVDGVEGGLTIEDTIALARALKGAGVDVIDCSSGGMAGSISLSPAKIRPGFQVPYAEAVRRDAGVATMAVGAIIEGPQANEIVATGKADLVAVGRELMADPGFAYRAAVALGYEGASGLLPDHYGFYLDRRAKVLER